MPFIKGQSGMKNRTHSKETNVFTRDDFTCVCCSRRGGDLEAHHIKKFSEIIKEYNIKTVEEALNCEELWNINNRQTLCKKCHNKTITRVIII